MGRFFRCLGLGLLVACGGAQGRSPAVKPLPVVAKVDPVAAQNHERAAALVTEGDAVLKVNVDSAIEKYAQALQAEPANLDALWKLSAAHEKKEDWAAVAATLQRAAAVTPSVEYLRGRGNALVELAREGSASAYELAREPLERCLKVDAKQAECLYLLGVVEEWSEHLQLAAEHYTLAARLDPRQARYYEALAELYRVFNRPLEAEMVLSEGLRQVPLGQRNRGELAVLALAAARLAALRNDAPTAQERLERAETLMDEAAPDLVFQVASIYASAVLGGTGPRDSAKALRLLNMFVKRVCRGSLATSYKDQCWVSDSIIQRLQYLDNVEPVAAASASTPVAVVPLPAGMPVPKLEMRAMRSGDAYTVWGASYSFRSRKHVAEVTAKPVAITGFIVRTNLGDAPRCAVHRGGVADPENCRAEIPAFWLGDRVDAAEADCIKVMGFASNYAQLFDAIRQADSQKPDEPYSDSFWGQIVPNPLPAAGAKVTVRGSYGPLFAKASSGAEMNLTMGILSYTDRDVLEPAPELATLPGVKRRKR